jgi:hypothetical protein
MQTDVRSMCETGYGDPGSNMDDSIGLVDERIKTSSSVETYCIASWI